MHEQDKHWSLRSRLLLIGLLASLSTLLAGLAAMLGASEWTNAKLQDQRLAELAAAVRSFAEIEIAEILGHGLTKLVHAEAASPEGSRYRYQVWTVHGNLLLRSHASASAPMVPIGTLGNKTVRIEDQALRVLAVRSGDGNEVIQVGEHIEDGYAGTWLIGRAFLGFVLPPFMLIVVVTAWQLRLALRTLNSSAAQLGTRGPLDLTPLRVEGPPMELLPLLTSINGLFGRIETAMSLERGFTAIAAHELRTPLAGLRAQAQIAATARSEAELRDALASVMRGVDRSAHLLDQMLNLARVESAASQTSSSRQALDVAAVCEAVFADIGGRAQARGVTLECDFKVAQIFATPLGLALLLSNLLGNAIRHVPHGGSIRVSTHGESDAVTLIVDDSGPGIPVQSRQQVFERFERLGALDDDGVGLGLSIVRSVVLAHDGSVQLLDSPLGGLRVQVRFRVKST